MKKIFVFAAFCTAMVACNSSDNKGTEKAGDNSSTAAAGEPTASANEKALEMIGALDCTVCHKISETSNGPAYTDVAKKYEPTEANIEMLANKVITGGSGT